MKIHQPILALAALTFSLSAFAQTPDSPSTKEARQTHLIVASDKVIGLAVNNESQKKLGDISDLVIDPRSGEIRYAVLECGGFLGLGEDHRVVPWSYIHVVADEKDADKCHARTNMTEAQLKAAPACKEGEIFDAKLDERVDAAFGKDEAWAYVGEGKPVFVCLSAMDDVAIQDPAGKEVGKARSFELAPQNGCIAYAVVKTTKDAGGKDVALPMAALKFSYDAEHKLTASTPVEITRFQEAPEYDSKDSKRMHSAPWVTEVTTFYSCEPFWKSTRFAAARKLPAQRP